MRSVATNGLRFGFQLRLPLQGALIQVVVIRFFRAIAGFA
jgi:hypothetical protein